MNLAICAIIKDEAPYLMEWLEYHFVKGVEHFFIYDNESADGSTEFLRMYARDGLITLIPWPGKSTPQNSRQLAAYKHCVKTFGHFTKWLACIDADEFICTKDQTIPEVLDDYSIYSAVAAHWVLFGNNGHDKKKEGLVIERFTKSEGTADRHVKSIIRPRHFRNTGKDVHHFIMDGRVVDENKIVLPEWYALGAERIPNTAKKIWINHYITKSTEEARKRFNRKRIDTGEPRDFHVHFPAHNKNNKRDESAFVYADAVHAAIARRHQSWRNQ